MTANELRTALTVKGVKLELQGNRLRATPWSALTVEEQEGVRANREQLKQLLRISPDDAPLPIPVATQAEVDQTPEIFVNGRLITEADVSRALRSLGDEAVAAYRSGEMTKTSAYEIAGRSVRDHLEARTGLSRTRR